jgi:acyl-CoA synthetase (NDP forming)
VGNEAVIDLGDTFAWAAADPHTKVVASYIETMRDPVSFGRGLDALRRARKPILMCAPEGRSEAARRSIVAHTGALAGDTALRDAWLRGRGAILVDDPVTMFEAAVLLSRERRLRSSGIAAALQSGGACTLFAEAAGARGLNLPEFARQTKVRLKRALPDFASQNNPLDVTGQAAVETDMFRRALAALAHDPAVGFVAFDAFPPRLADESVWAEPVLEEVRRLRKETGVVFASVAMSPLGYTKAARDFVDRAGLPFLQGHRAAAGAIRALVELQGLGRGSVEIGPHENRAKALRLLRGLAGPLDEARAAGVLELYGVRRPKETVVTTPRRAADAARRIGFPVAVKALAPELPHKAKLGAVKLGLTNKTDVEIAASEVVRAAERAGAPAARLLVQRMATGDELLVGAVVDESFGACVTMRPGGALAEAGDAVFASAPLTPSQAESYVRSQAGRCGLEPGRHDLKAVAKAVAAIARAADDLRGRLTSLEANPLLVGARGAVAVDALAEARPPA